MDNFLITGLGAKQILNTSGLDFCWEKKESFDFWGQENYLTKIEIWEDLIIDNQILLFNWNKTRNITLRKKFNSIRKHFKTLFSFNN